MQRIIVGAVATAALALPAAAGAAPGSPGSTFPEQPGGHVAQGCVSVISNTGTGSAHHADIADAITLGLLTDACS